MTVWLCCFKTCGGAAYHGSRCGKTIYIVTEELRDEEEENEEEGGKEQARKEGRNYAVMHISIGQKIPLGSIL